MARSAGAFVFGGCGGFPSSKFLLDQLRDQGKRIEKLSRLEHDLIKEVHPQVNEIKEGMEAMIAVVTENLESKPPVIKRK